MMQQMGQYVLSLTSAAILCSVVLSMFRDGTVRRILRIVCAIILTITALSPLTDYKIPALSELSGCYLSEGKAIASMGEDLAGLEKQKCIQHNFEAYILDKANGMGANLKPEVTVDANGFPLKIRLQGQCSERIREKLADMITNDLGIPKEDQKWTGQT